MHSVMRKESSAFKVKDAVGEGVSTRPKDRSGSNLHSARLHVRVVGELAVEAARLLRVVA